MMIFRILCGEWIEPLWDCMRAEKDVKHFKYKEMINAFKKIKLLL